jgi:hypothetical protein
MSARVQYRENADPYEVELEELARSAHEKSNDRWMWIIGSIMACVIVIGLVITIVKLASHKKKKSFLFA